MQDLHNNTFWQDLIPELTIEGPKAAVQIPPFKKGTLTCIADHVMLEGYVYEQAVIPETILAPLRSGMEKLDTADIPAVFIYLFDEAWHLFGAISPLIEHFLGNQFKLLPNLWAWNIPPTAGASGWRPHVDCQAETRFKISKDEQILMSLSLWIPLTDATLENGCMHVLPRSKEQNYPEAITDPQQINFDDCRPLPAKSGSILGWSQDLWHWGGSVTDKATHSRRSLSLEFQNPAFDPLIGPFLDINNPPAFNERLAIILKQFKKYDHMEMVDFDVAKLGAS